MIILVTRNMQQYTIQVLENVERMYISIYLYYMLKFKVICSIQAAYTPRNTSERNGMRFPGNSSRICQRLSTFICLVMA